MSLIQQFLVGRPKLQQAYKRCSLFYDSYTVFFPHQIRYLRSRLTTKNPKKILCYPQCANACYTIFKICYMNGYKLVSRPQPVDLIIYFDDQTHRTPDATLQALAARHQVLNYRSGDISKKYVDIIHKQVFGYGVTIDPQKHKGKYVKKSDENSLHNYLIQDAPEKPEAGYVYQRVVNNEEGGEVVDIRLPIFRNLIPVAYLKYRPIDSRFDTGNSRVRVQKVADILSAKERSLIIRFCQEIGLDTGELDVLRDKDTGKIYIVDANNTPGGPPLEFTPEELETVLQLQADAFAKAFFPPEKKNRI